MTEFTMIEEPATFEFEGEVYEYNAAAVKSLAMARAVYAAGKDAERLIDAWEATFGANADAYWYQLADDSKAAELITSIYQARSKN